VPAVDRAQRTIRVLLEDGVNRRVILTNKRKARIGLVPIGTVLAFFAQRKTKSAKSSVMFESRFSISSSYLLRCSVIGGKDEDVLLLATNFQRARRYQRFARQGQPPPRGLRNPITHPKESLLGKKTAATCLSFPSSGSLYLSKTRSLLVSGIEVTL